MSAPSKPTGETIFVNEMRLTARQWAWVIVIGLAAVVSVPWIWKKVERFDAGPDYRIPYELSKDYWLYHRRAERFTPENIVVIGDSVVWGEYVLPNGTFSHFLNQEAGKQDQFINAGVNGMFPLALEGLVKHYGERIQGHKVILHCNLLWLSSPKADLQTHKTEQFNHSRLVPQFTPKIPCYGAELSDKLGAIVERNFPMIQWATHLENAYFGQKSILQWTLMDDGGDPPRYTNSYRNPLRQITMEVPKAPENDPERGPASPRHRPWSTTGKGSARFEWVTLQSSLQWAAFQRLVQFLKSRDDDVLVVVGPFNEHFMDEENQVTFRKLRDGVGEWLSANQIPHVTAELLPSNLYADASHPLTEGYQLMAKQLYGHAEFQKWLVAHRTNSK